MCPRIGALSQDPRQKTPQKLTIVPVASAKKRNVSFALTIAAIIAGAVGFFSLLEMLAKSGDRQDRPPPSLPEQVEDDPTATLFMRWMGPPSFPGAREGLYGETVVEERFNVDIQPLFMDPTGYDRKRPLMLSGGDSPHVMWEANPLTLQKAVNHRFIVGVPPELIREHAPTYFETISRRAPLGWLYANVDGRNYGMPTPAGGALALPRPGVWRADWLRNVGITKSPETLEEYYEALRRFTFDDPDQNGLDDTYGMSGDISYWWWASFSEVFGAYNVLPFDWVERDGEIVWGGILPETKTVLGILREWAAEGIIHPDFVTDNSTPGQSIERKFYGGLIGYIYYRGRKWEMDLGSSSGMHLNVLTLNFEEILRTQAWLTNWLVPYVPARVVEDLQLFRIDDLGADFPEYLRKPVRERFRGDAERYLSDPEDVTRAVALLDTFLEKISQDIRIKMVGEFRKALAMGIAPSELILDPEPWSEEAIAELSQPEVDSLPYALRRYVYRAIAQTMYAHLEESLPASERRAIAAELQEIWTEALRRELSGSAATNALDVLAGRGELSFETRAEIAEHVVDGDFNRDLVRMQERLRERVEIDREEAIFETVFVDMQTTMREAARWEIKHDEVNAFPIIEPALFPIGPDGHRGGRVWGTAGNIITFGPDTLEDPRIAVRAMKIFEESYVNRQFYMDVRAGREGLHWEWSDPELGEIGSIGMVEEYEDPLSGEILNLKEGDTAYRNLLNNDVSFWALAGGKEAFSRYFNDVRVTDFQDTYQREEWGLANALGKSDVVPSASRYLGDLRVYQQTVFAEIIRGERPLDYFDTFVQEWLARGGAILTEEANELKAQMDEIYERIGVSNYVE